eukprot:TRINITY_DN435_c0_g3_i1.p1 TRINITY_DN435_c0_g3~~TRINITY_DN435_c0_g3_i1.p1  ORF type:complete len:187 (+),score=45.46 TRINITY_DN435_c0_g3_i1:148-708(+)
MKVGLILGFALIIVLVNGGRFDGCKFYFEEVSRHPIFNKKDASAKFIKENTDSLIAMYNTLWKKCDGEFKNLQGVTPNAAGSIYDANTGLDRGMRQMKKEFTDKDNPQKIFTAIWLNFVHHIRGAVHFGFKYANNPECRRQAEALRNLYYPPTTLAQAFEIGWRTFDAFDVCDRHKNEGFFAPRSF